MAAIYHRGHQKEVDKVSQGIQRAVVAAENAARGPLPSGFPSLEGSFDHIPPKYSWSEIIEALSHVSSFH